MAVPAGAHRVNSPGRYSLLFSVSEHVLKSYDFKIDRSDRRNGLITTDLATGKNFFEFWRKDAATAADTLENSLNNIYRSAEVRFAPQTDPERGWDIQVNVTVYRAEYADSSITGTSQAYSLYSQSRGSRKNRIKRSAEGVEPIKTETIGSDELLASKIRKDIVKKLEKMLGESI